MRNGSSVSLTKFRRDGLRCPSLTHKRCRTSQEPSSRRPTRRIGAFRPHECSPQDARGLENGIDGGYSAPIRRTPPQAPRETGCVEIFVNSQSVKGARIGRAIALRCRSGTAHLISRHLYRVGGSQDHRQHGSAERRTCLSIPGDLYDRAADDDGGWQRSGGVCRAPRERSDRDLSDHTLLGDGRACRRMVESRPKEPLGQHPGRRRNAVGGRCRGSRARCPASRRPGHDLHCVAGTAPDDPQHVQDRGRADPLHDARRRAHHRHARTVHLRRPLRRDGLPDDRFRHAQLLVRAGGPRFRGHRARGHARLASPVHPLLRRLSDITRDVENRSARRRRPASVAVRRRRGGTSPAGVDARPSRAPGDRTEPRHVLSGARSGESLLSRVPGHRRGLDGAVRHADGAPVRLVRLRRTPRGRACRRDHGISAPARSTRPSTTSSPVERRWAW